MVDKIEPRCGYTHKSGRMQVVERLYGRGRNRTVVWYWQDTKPRSRTPLRIFRQDVIREQWRADGKYKDADQ